MNGLILSTHNQPRIGNYEMFIIIQVLTKTAMLAGYYCGLGEWDGSL